MTKTLIFGSYFGFEDFKLITVAYPLELNCVKFERDQRSFLNINILVTYFFL
jgi:hypothetical protein